MGHAQELDWVRTLVNTRLAQLAGCDAEEALETILVRDGCYCGRCFGLGDWRAVWFVEERQVKFFNAEGTFHESAQVNPEHRIDERAA